MRAPSESLRFRLFGLSVVWVLAGLAVSGVLIGEVFRYHLTEQFRADLRLHLQELSNAVAVEPDGRPSLRHPISDPRFLSAGTGYYYQVERAGRPALRSFSLGGGALSGSFAASGTPRGGAAQGPRGPAIEYGRILEASDGGPPLRISIAGELSALDADLKSVRRMLISTLGVFGAVLIAGVVLQLTFGLRPLDKLGRAVAEMRSTGRAIEGARFPSEIQPLIQDLRDLLAANEAMVQRARVQAGNLAHGLRTPLSIVMDEAERLERAGQAESAAALLEQCQRMQKQIDYHMARSRAAAAIPVGRTTSIADALQPVLAAMSRLHGRRGVVFEWEPGPDLRAACDPVDYAEIVSALLDNAGKWAAARVTVRWLRRGALAVTLIDDDGPGLPPASRETVFAVGERLDDTVSGAGLGLAIARDLAALYGGTVRLEDTDGGQGLRAAVELPLAEPDKPR